MSAEVHASRAKINLGLRVLERRPDGYHNLVSLFREVDLSDEVRFRDREDGRITVCADAPGVPNDASNLAVRAALRLRQELGGSDGVDIQLTKRIPAGGGLGGGSSNAATVLRVLNEKWRGGLPPESLASLGADIGSDVPFFIHGGAAVVTGRGEVVQPVRIRGECAFLLVFPDFRMATAEAFAGLRIGLTAGTPYISFLNSALDLGEVSLAELLPRIENDFLGVVLDAHPDASRIVDGLNAAGSRCSSLSGSGSTFFGVFGSRPEAVDAASRMAHEGFVCTVCAGAG